MVEGGSPTQHAELHGKLKTEIERAFCWYSWIANEQLWMASALLLAAAWSLVAVPQLIDAIRAGTPFGEVQTINIVTKEVLDSRPIGAVESLANNFPIIVFSQ